MKAGRFEKVTLEQFEHDWLKQFEDQGMLKPGTTEKAAKFGKIDESKTGK